MAGLSIDYIRQQLNTNNPLARIMPNTNAQVGHSVTGISFSNNFDPKSKNEVDELINAFGSVIEVSKNIYIKLLQLQEVGRHFYIMYLNNM